MRSSINTRSPMPMPKAPPEAPSPMTMQITGTQLAHFNQVAGNGLALSALLSLQPGKGPGVSIKVTMGAIEFLRQFHEAQGLA